jgi:hypothetical protein
MLFFKESYSDILHQISTEIKRTENSNLNGYNRERMINKNKFAKFGEMSEKISQLKNFSLFNKIYFSFCFQNETQNFEYSYGRVQNIGQLLEKNESIFEIYKKNKEIFDEIRDDL